MSSQVTITQLPLASTLTGNESVPIVQNGVTVQTTTGAISTQPSLTQTFLTKNQELALPNSRYLAVSTGLSLTDGGADSYYTIGMTGAAASLNTIGSGLIAKNATNTVVNRSISTSGGGISVVNGDGTGGNPTLSLAGIPGSIQNLGSGYGLITLNGSTAVLTSILGTTNQISVANGNGNGNPIISLASNPVLPGTGAVTLPQGTNAQRPAGSYGQFRYNTDTNNFEGYNGLWLPFTVGSGVGTFSAGTTGFLPNSPTAGNIVLTGTLNVLSGGTGTNNLTGYVKGNGTSAMTAVTAIPYSDILGVGNMAIQNANSVAITGGNINGTSITNSSIDNTIIGGTTPTSATFTSLATNTGTISSTPVLGTDIANKAYVDNVASAGIDIHPSVVDYSGSNLSATYAQGGTTPTWTTIAGNVLTTGSAHGLSVNDQIVFTSSTNGITAGIPYYVFSVPSGTQITLSLAYDGVQYTGLTNGTGLSIGSRANSGVGATLTSTTNGPLVIGSYTAALNDRILVTDQSNAAQNGVYYISQIGVVSVSPWILTRATDGNKYIPDSNQGLDTGAYFLVTGGNNIGQSYVLSTTGQIIIGTTNLTFAQFSQSPSYTAGTGLTLSGNQFSITNTGVTASSYGTASSVPKLSINAQGQITTASNTPIAITSSQVSGLAASATTDTTNANNITSGTLASGLLSGSYTGITGVGTLTAGTWNASAIGVGYGGTGLIATPTNGQLLIGNGAGYTLSTLTAGTNVVVTNTAGGITISASASAGGTVTSVNVSGGTTGLTTSGGPITSSGTITLAGTLNVANGGTGTTTLTGYVYGNGTGAMTASTTIPNTAITGLGTMSTQNASSVAITGGSIDGTPVGATTASTMRGTTITATTQFSGPGTGLTGTASGLSIGGSASSATTATTATNIAGGSGGAIAYNSASGTTTFLGLGTTNYVLTAGASAPQYVAQSTLSVGSASTATTATNISGGSAGAIAYNSASSATTFLGLGTTGYFLTAGATAPQWTQTLPIANGGTGQTTQSAAFNALSPITTTGDIIIGNGTNSATRLPIGTNGYLLTSNGTTASWQPAPATGISQAKVTALVMTLGF